MQQESALTVTTVSTGSDHDGWRVWWAIERRRCGTDWESLLDQHYQVFQQLRQHVGLSS
jgi:hypothetical protein